MKKYIPHIGIILIAFLASLPLWMDPGKCSDKDDFDYFLSIYEAARVSILEYGEFPFWNAWSHGGVPLFANPQLAFFAPEMLCSLLFGTFFGLRFSVFIYMLIAGFGMYFLIGDYTNNNFARWYGSSIFILAGALPAHLVNGHFVFLGFMYLPFILYFLNRFFRDWKYAAAAGAMCAMLFNQNIQYASLFCGITALAWFIPSACRHWKDKKLYLHGLLSFTVLLSLCGYRLLLTLDYFREYPRLMTDRAHIYLEEFLSALVIPFQDLSRTAGYFPTLKNFYWEWHETACYIGIIVISFVLISMIARWRFYHWAILLTGLLAADSCLCWNPGFWMRFIPGYSSAFVMTRWRFVMLVFIGISAAAGLAWIWKRVRRKGKIITGCLVFVSCTMMFANIWHIERKAVELFPEETFRDRVPGFQKKGNFEPHFFNSIKHFYFAVKHNINHMAGSEPQLGYDQIIPFAYTCVGKPGYQGAFLSDHAKMLYRTPNTIAIRTGGPCRVFISANPGNYWVCNSFRLFPEMRSFETGKRFYFKLAVPAGDYLLQAVPRMHMPGLFVTGIAMIVSLLLMLYLHKRKSFAV